MRTIQQNNKEEPHKLEFTTILIRAKYQLWNQEGRPIPVPHVWLCDFLQADYEKKRKRSTNWYKFVKVCKKIAGDQKIKVTREAVWKYLALYFVSAKHWGPLSDDESDASCGNGWEKSKSRPRKLKF